MHEDVHNAGNGAAIADKIKNAVWRRRLFLLIVVLPTILVALYFQIIAAPQYETEAHILVRNVQSSAQEPSGLGQALSLVGGGVSPAQSEAMSVSDYLSSHDAVNSMRRTVDLVRKYRRPEADIFSMLRPEDPTPERLLNYFRGQSDIRFNSETGITTVKVRSFRPQDSLDIVNALLQLGEERVNFLNQRAYSSTLSASRKQLLEAENAMDSAQRALTAFRQHRRNIDPLATGQAQIGVVSNLEASLAQARAQRAALGQSVSSTSPQARALDIRVQALKAQVDAEAGRLSGSQTAIAADVGDYQELQLRQQFAGKQFDAASASLERAREQAIRQQLFIVRVVSPNLAVKALYPKSLKIVATLFFGLLLSYSIGWLIAAGVREHAA